MIEPERQTKDSLRRAMLARRAALTGGEVAARSAAATERLLALDILGAPGGRAVCLYAGVRGELDPSVAEAELVARGARVAYPRTGPAPTLSFHAARRSELAAAAFGLREPRGDAPAVTPEEVLLCVVPGLAFDRSGHRVGHGKGYYDAALPALRAAGAVVAGFCHAFQVVPRCPRGVGDVPVDLIVTEEACLPVDPTNDERGEDP